MLKNYFKIALRNILKNKIYSFINIAGLAIGIAGSLLIFIYVANQLSYESMHKNRSHIYRISVNFASMKMATAVPAIGPAAIYEQLNFMQNSDLGFNKKNVLIVNYPISNKEDAEKFLVVKQAFQSIPGVIDVSGSSTLPGTNYKEIQSVRIKGKSEKGFSMFKAIAVDYEFISTLGLKIIKGRNFSKKFASDSLDAIILNETAVKKLGLKNPLGVEVYVPDRANRERLVKIIGIIKDFHATSFHKVIEPVFLYINSEKYYNIALKINTGNTGKIITSLKSDWKKILPDKEFDYSFLDQTYDNLYQSDKKTGSLFSIFSFLSILIACMGLFGLVSYTVEVRTKEIGIRKVLGADLKSIAMLLSKDFIKWILIANILAWPLAYYAISKWLDEFAYQTTISISIFISATIIVLLIALTTVSFKAIRAATANPVESLRYE